jgi:hypothetical protein
MEEKMKTLEEISASITRYYDSLTEEEVAEDRAWGEFAAAQFDERGCQDQPGDGVVTELGRVKVAL